MNNKVGHLLGAARLRVLGAPLIYERFRPWLLGYHDESDLFQYLDCQKTDVILDIGCGSGAAFKYLSNFESYHGFDVEPTVLDRLRERYPDPHIHCHPERSRRMTVRTASVGWALAHADPNLKA